MDNVRVPFVPANRLTVSCEEIEFCGNRVQFTTTFTRVFSAFPCWVGESGGPVWCSIEPGGQTITVHTTECSLTHRKVRVTSFGW